MPLKLPVNPNYCATVVDIKNIVQLDNCDNVVHTNIFGNLVVVGKDTEVGDVGMFFPPETELSKDFLLNNNLYRHSELNVDKEKKGYFEDNGRIRTVKFRGNKSMGFFIPLNFLDFTNHSEKLKVGDTFDEINGIKICQKYVIFVKNVGQWVPKSKKERVSRIVDNQFRFHQDTEQLGKNIHRLKEDDIIQVSHKLHGCVSKDTLIETLEHKNLTIKEIVDNKIKCQIKSFDIERNKIVFVPIDDFYFKPNDGDWYELELENGQKIQITGNNPVWIPELNIYKNIDSLIEGDIILFDKSM